MWRKLCLNVREEKRVQVQNCWNVQTSFAPLLTINTKVWNNWFILLISNLIDLAEIFPLLRECDKEEKGDSSVLVSSAPISRISTTDSGCSPVHLSHSSVWHQYGASRILRVRLGTGSWFEHILTCWVSLQIGWVPVIKKHQPHISDYYQMSQWPHSNYKKFLLFILYCQKELHSQ